MPHKWGTNYVTTSFHSPERSDKNATIPKAPSSRLTVSPGLSGTVKRKSLFDLRNNDDSKKLCGNTAKPASSSVRDQPCFKPSQLGSPFYPGRTMYGGAASSYVYHPNIRQRKELVFNTDKFTPINNTISHLTPLNDSQRLPQYTSYSIHSNANANLDSSSTITSKSISYKTQELHVPSLASILRLKQRSRLMDSTAAARQAASHSSTADIMPYPITQYTRDQTDKESSNKFTSKVKSRLTRPNRRNLSDLETELPAPVNLPTAVLQIDQCKLPKFSLGPQTQPLPVKPLATRPVDQPLAVSTSLSNDIDTVNYKFANPVRISAEHSAQSAVTSGFTFGSPERTIDRPQESDKSIHSFALNTPKQIESKQKDWKCSDCWVSNRVESDMCVCCGGKKPNALSSTIKVNEISQPVPKKSDGEWKVGACWVNNNTSSAKCGDAQWKCNYCWIENKGDAKCAACGAARQADNTHNKPADTFKATFKAHTEKWECPNCLVRNDNNKAKCVCCETDRPGLTTSASKTTFNFGTSASTAFKFGIPNMQATSTVPPVETKTTVETTPTNHEESETNNNVIPKIPSFTFGLPSKKSVDQTDTANQQESVTSDTTKLHFSFGIPKPSVPTSTPTVESSPSALTSVAPVVAVGIPNKIPSTPITNETVQENPQEDPKATVSELQETSKPYILASPALSEKSSSECMTLSKPLVSDSTSTTTTAAPTPTFLFGAPTTTSAFVAPATATTAAAPFLKKPEPTVTTSSASVFASNNASSTPSMFQKSEGLPTSTPLFSFGSNNQNATAKAETPMFNFSFGSTNKTDNAITPLDATTYTSETNKFTLPNALGSGNSLTNSQGGENGLSSAVGIGSNSPVMTATLGGGELDRNAVLSGGLFGSSATKDGMWSTASSTLAVPAAGMFAATTPQPPPPAFTFSTSTPFNLAAASPFGATSQTTSAFGAVPSSTTPFAAASQATPAFGAVTQPTPASGAQTTPAFGDGAQTTPGFGAPSTSAFGAVTSGPTFGASTQPGAFGNAMHPATNMFGLGGQNGPSQPSPFGSSAGGAAAPGIFGTLGAPLGVPFGSSTAAASTSGAPSPSQPPFEAPSLTPALAPTFNFTPQSGVFGFGQAPQSGVQFNMDSGVAAQRRIVLKAVRRSNQRQ